MNKIILIVLVVFLPQYLFFVTNIEVAATPVVLLVIFYKTVINDGDFLKVFNIKFIHEKRLKGFNVFEYLLSLSLVVFGFYDFSTLSRFISLDLTELNTSSIILYIFIDLFLSAIFYRFIFRDLTIEN